MASWARSVLSRCVRQEKGAALVLVLIFMLLGALITTPLLGYMASGMSRGQMYQNRTHELYAANAGVREAIWNLMMGTQVPAGGSSLDLALLPVDVNGKPRTVSIFCREKRRIGGIYKITSAALTPGSSNTTIEAWVDTLPFFFDYGLISTDTISLQPGTAVNGNVAGTVVGPGDPTQYIAGRIDGPWDPAKWPFTIYRSFYWTPDVSGNSLPAKIDVKSMPVIQAGNRNGNLTIEDSSGGSTVALGGTLYVKGDLDLGKAKDFTIDLAYQTIYVEGSINTPPGRPTFIGSGCIIAEGDINFRPRIQSDPDEYVFVMSINGKVNFQPTGEFYGSVAGKLNINLQPGNTITQTTPPPDLNFPDTAQGVESAVHVHAWKVSPPFSIADTEPSTVTGALPP